MAIEILLNRALVAPFNIAKSQLSIIGTSSNSLSEDGPRLLGESHLRAPVSVSQPNEVTYFLCANRLCVLPFHPPVYDLITPLTTVAMTL